MAKALGGDIRLGAPGEHVSLKTAEERAQAYVAQDPSSRFLSPFGLRKERGDPVFELFRSTLLEALCYVQAPPKRCVKRYNMLTCLPLFKIFLGDNEYIICLRFVQHVACEWKRIHNGCVAQYLAKDQVHDCGGEAGFVIIVYLYIDDLVSSLHQVGKNVWKEVLAGKQYQLFKCPQFFSDSVPEELRPTSYRLFENVSVHSALLKRNFVLLKFSVVISFDVHVLYLY